MVKLTWKNCFRVVASAFALYLMIHYWDGLTGVLLALFAAGSALILGALIAYVVNIPMTFYETHLFPPLRTRRAQALRRACCMLLAYASVLAIAFILVRLIVPELVDCVQILIQKIEPYAEKLLEYLNNNINLDLILGSTDLFPSGEIDWQSILSMAVQLFITGLGGVVNSLVALLSATFSIAVSIFLSVIFSIYLLTGKERIGGQIRRVLRAYSRPRWNRRFFYVIDVFDDCFHRFIVGQCTEAFILGILCILGMTVFKFPYASMIGTLVGFTALIPIAGAYIGAGIGAFMIFTVNPLQALLFLIFIVFLQQFEGNVIYPKVVGSSIGLPGIWVLAAITLGGGIAGIAGMLLGVPLAASLYKLLVADVRRREAFYDPPSPVPDSSQS